MNLSIKAISCAVFVATSFVNARESQKPLAEPSSSPFSSEFDALVEKSLSHFHVPGLSIAVIDGNQTFAKGYGFAVYPDTEATPETLYWTGSTTKSFTAAAISLLIDDTTNTSTPIQWITPISSLIRNDFVLPDDYATMHVTLEDAASHRTGMPRHDASYSQISTVRDIVRNLRNLPITAQIRTKWQYCNMMFMVLSHVVESLTGMWLGDFLRLRIWEPLSMSSTYFALRDAQKAVATEGKTIARGYFWQNRTQRYIPEDWLEGPRETGDGAIISNVLDYAAYLRAMMDQAPPLSPAGHAALRTPRSFADPVQQLPTVGPITYGLGWELGSYRGEALIYHGGAVRGFGALMLYMPWRKWGMVMMANTMFTSNYVEEILQYALLDQVLRTPEDEKIDWWKKIDEKNGEAQGWVNARERLFPDAPKRPIPLSLPMKEYVGVYESEGYGVLNVTLATETDRTDGVESDKVGEGVLRADLAKSAGFEVELEHVSGEYFLAKAALVLTDGSHDPFTATKAEWKIDAAGKAVEVGVCIEPMMGEEMIWWKRVG